MFSLPRSGPVRTFDYRAVDLRSIAEPIAVLSPVALVVGWQEPVMTLVSVLFVLHSWRASANFRLGRTGLVRRSVALWAYKLIRPCVGHPTATGVLIALRVKSLFRSMRPLWRIGTCRMKDREIVCCWRPAPRSPSMRSIACCNISRDETLSGGPPGRPSDEPFSQAGGRRPDRLADGGRPFSAFGKGETRPSRSSSAWSARSPSC